MNVGDTCLPVHWFRHWLATCLMPSYYLNHCWYVEGILPKGPYLPFVSMAGRALLTGFDIDVINCTPRTKLKRNGKKVNSSVLSKILFYWDFLILIPEEISNYILFPKDCTTEVRNGQFHSTPYRVCDYLSMLRLMLNQVSKRGHSKCISNVHISIFYAFSLGKANGFLKTEWQFDVTFTANLIQSSSE